MIPADNPQQFQFPMSPGRMRRLSSAISGANRRLKPTGIRSENDLGFDMALSIDAMLSPNRGFPQKTLAPAGRTRGSCLSTCAPVGVAMRYASILLVENASASGSHLAPSAPTGS